MTEGSELERTLRSVSESAEVAHVLLGLSSSLSEIRTVQETLDTAVRMTAALLAGKRCYAATHDGASGAFTITASYGFDDEELTSLRKFAKKGGLPLLRAALSDKAPLLVSDVSQDDRITSAEIEARGLGAYVGIPLIRWGRDFGGLAIEFDAPRELGNTEASLARGIARQVGVALSNARRFNLFRDLRSFGLQLGRSGLRLASVTREVATGAMSLLAADAAVVGLLDAERRELESVRSRGLTREVREGLTRIPIAAGPLAPVLAGETATPDDLSFLPEGAGYRSIVAAPILGPDGSTVGAIVLAFERAFALGAEEAEALDVLAAQSALAIENARRFEQQRRVARSLQKALLSLDSTGLEECSYGAVYEPADEAAEVGGDFFDAFDLADGRIGLVVGDVAGKGTVAAALTAMAKYMLRAFAMRDSSPASVLYHLNNALARAFDEDRFVTLMYAVIDPAAGTCQLALGGHPAPVVFRAKSGVAEQVDLQGAILGAFPDQQYQMKSLDVGAKDVLLAFTDGLTEARVENELYGIERVTESLVKHGSNLSGEALARRIYRDAGEFGTVADDTVVFVLSCKGSS